MTGPQRTPGNVTQHVFGVPGPAEPGDREDKKRQKKKDKVRAAWISFVGRILAQFVGAAATVALGIILARHIHPSSPSPASGSGPPPPPPTPVVARAAREGVSIAVLPLTNLSGEAGQDRFADSLTDALITRLAKVRTLHVISRTSVMRYKDERRSLPDLARELGVDAVVEGTVVKAGGRVRVTAQLIDGKSDEHLWAESYDRDLRDILALQDDVAQAIAREVSRSLLPAPTAAAPGLSKVPE